MAEARVDTRLTRSSSDVLGSVRERGVYVALGLLIVFNAVFTDNFLTLSTLETNLIQVAPIIIVSLGMALVIGTEGIDLSVGAVMAIASALIPIYLIGYNPWVSIGICLLAGAVVGLINGSMVAFLGVQPIVATLALLVAGRGIALVFAGGQLKEVFDPLYGTIGSGEVAGISIRVLVALALALAIAVLVRRTIFGRRLVAIGGNREASSFAGLPLRTTLIAVYVISAVLASVAGILETARSGASNPSNIGQLIELSAITAVVIGGTPLTGGRVRILGTVLAALFLQLLTATLIRQDVPASGTQMVQALVIIAAVYIHREKGTA